MVESRADILVCVVFIVSGPIISYQDRSFSCREMICAIFMLVFGALRCIMVLKNPS